MTELEVSLWYPTKVDSCYKDNLNCSDEAVKVGAKLNALDYNVSICNSTIRDKDCIGNMFYGCDAKLYHKRDKFGMTIEGYNASEIHLKSLLISLTIQNMALVFVGDSMTKQNLDSLPTELYREGVRFKISGGHLPKPRTNLKGQTTFTELLFESLDRSGINVTIFYVSWGYFGNNEQKKVFEDMLNSTSYKDKKGAIFLINFGVHYNRFEYYFNQQISDAFKYFPTIIAEPGRKFQLFWRESTAQHFIAPYGIYIPQGPHGCIPHEHEGYDNRIKVTFELYKKYSNISEYLSHSHPSMLWSYIPFYNVTKHLENMHIISYDCTHYCPHPAFWYIVWKELNEKTNLWV